VKCVFLSFSILLAAMGSDILAGGVGANAATKPTLRTEMLRCEYLTDPLGIGTSNPRFSWTITADARGTRQQAYQILVATEKKRLNENLADLWTSGRINSDMMAQIVYAGKPLRSEMRCYWTVRVWDQHGNSSAWSEPAMFTVGLLHAADWNASWIGAPPETPSELHDPPIPPSPLLRKSFSLTGEVLRAMVYVTSLGDYELRLNGRKVGNYLLAPEWTDYTKRVQYQTYDVTPMLHSGMNVLGAMLADGWYAGRIGPTRWDKEYPRRGPYGLNRRLLLKLVVEKQDGTRQIVVSDGTWQMNQDGPIRAADNFLGETYDARKEKPGWDMPGFKSRGWSRVTVDSSVRIELDAQMNEPITEITELKPRRVSEPKPGVYIVDLGQNMVGWCRVRLGGPAGAIVTLRHGEMLSSDGTLYTENLAGAIQTDTYTLNGKGEREFEPHFTYHGFRYVEITGVPSKPTPDMVTGIVFASAAPPAGTILMSDSLFNRIVQNTLWSQHGNMHSVPTDCPQRDERMGWMGDAQVFSQTSMFNLDMAAFYTKWIRDIRDAQAKDGRYPDFAPQPYYPGVRFMNAPGWADAGVIVPWRLYQNYGDTRILEQHYASVVRFIEHIRETNPDLIWKNDVGNRYGDWLNGNTIIAADYPRTGGNMPHDAYATAFFAHSTEILSKMARVLGKAYDAEHYGRLAAQIREAFLKQFVDPSGEIDGDTQAGYALALNFDLLPEGMRGEAAQRMVEAVRRYDGRMSTGFQSTLRMMMELSRYKYSSVAYALAESHRLPSWGYSIDQGATTIWERWDAYVAGRGFQDAGMNSFNHYSFGSVVEWMYRTILGINYDEQKPGYRHIILEPIPGGSLQWARGVYRSISGPISVDWKVLNGRFLLAVSIPANTEATLSVPTTEPALITESGIASATAEGVTLLDAAPGTARFHLASGSYRFDSPFDAEKYAEINKNPFAYVPRLSPPGAVFHAPDSGVVEMSSETPGALVRYTLDGSEPTERSFEYTKPIRITKALVVKARAFRDGLKPSIVATGMYDVVIPGRNGMNFRLYEGEGWKTIPEFDTLAPVDRGIVQGFDLGTIGKGQGSWGIRFFSFLNVAERGDYAFFLTSAGGSRLSIDGKTVVDNDGLHNALEKSGTVLLIPGFHAFILDYCKGTSEGVLDLKVEGPGIPRRPLPASMTTLVLDKHVRPE
jgi:alpha-L-rhamnosidase